MAAGIAVLAAVLALGPLGDGPKRSETRTSIGRLQLARSPYMGVACRMPNSIACDRVGLAVYLAKRDRVDLKHGPLKVTPTKPVFATVHITAHYDDGSSRSTTRRVGLAPGWG